MNQKNLIISVLTAFTLTIPTANFVHAQVPVVPRPTCVDVPGIPCPKDWETNVETKRQQPATSESSNEAFKQLQQIIERMNKILIEMMLGFRHTITDIRERFQSFFDNWSGYKKDIKF